MANGFDFWRLRGRIKNTGYSIKSLAENIGMAYWTLCQRLNGSLDFQSSEIAKICEVLGIPDAEIPGYFFERKIS